MIHLHVLLASGWSVVFSVNEIDLQLILKFEISLTEALSTHGTSTAPPLFIEVSVTIQKSVRLIFFIFLRFCYLILELFRYRGILRFSIYYATLFKNGT